MTDQPDTRAVTIPALEAHQGIMITVVILAWVCPKCGQPRGVPYETRSYDGSRPVGCDGWQNACGHVDKYNAVRQEAARNGLNTKAKARIV